MAQCDRKDQCVLCHHLNGLRQSLRRCGGLAGGTSWAAARRAVWVSGAAVEAGRDRRIVDGEGAFPAQVAGEGEPLAEMRFAYPTFTEAVSMAAQKICRTIGIGHLLPAWSYLGPQNEPPVEAAAGAGTRDRGSGPAEYLDVLAYNHAHARNAYALRTRPSTGPAGPASTANRSVGLLAYMRPDSDILRAPPAACLRQGWDQVQRSRDRFETHRVPLRRRASVSAPEGSLAQFVSHSPLSGAVHRRTRLPIHLGQEHWRPVVNGGAQYSKACEGASLPWVQIPPPPPLTCKNTDPDSRQAGRVVLPRSHLVVSVTSRMRSHRRAQPQLSWLVMAIADDLEQKYARRWGVHPAR